MHTVEHYSILCNSTWLSISLAVSKFWIMNICTINYFAGHELQLLRFFSPSQFVIISPSPWQTCNWLCMFHMLLFYLFSQRDNLLIIFIYDGLKKRHPTVENMAGELYWHWKRRKTQMIPQIMLTDTQNQLATGALWSKTVKSWIKFKRFNWPNAFENAVCGILFKFSCVNRFFSYSYFTTYDVMTVKYKLRNIRHRHHWITWPLLATWATDLKPKLVLTFKGCVSLDPSKISKSGWWGLQLNTWQLCNSLWYGLINSKLHINKKFFFHITQHQTVSHVQCFKSPSWPLRDGLDLWPQLIYTLSRESQHEEI